DEVRTLPPAHCAARASPPALLWARPVRRLARPLAPAPAPPVRARPARVQRPAPTRSRRRLQTVARFDRWGPVPPVPPPPVGHRRPGTRSATPSGGWAIDARPAGRRARRRAQLAARRARRRPA